MQTYSQSCRATTMNHISLFDGHCGVQRGCTGNKTYQCRYGEDLNRKSSDGYTPLMVVIDEVLL